MPQKKMLKNEKETRVFLTSKKDNNEVIQPKRSICPEKHKNKWIFTTIIEITMKFASKEKHKPSSIRIQKKSIIILLHFRILFVPRIQTQPGMRYSQLIFWFLSFKKYKEPKGIQQERNNYHNTSHFDISAQTSNPSIPIRTSSPRKKKDDPFMHSKTKLQLFLNQIHALYEQLYCASGPELLPHVCCSHLFS